MLNWHRYKASISLRTSGDTQYEFVGTWIGFAGMLVIIIHASVGVSVKEVMFLASPIPYWRFWGLLIGLRAKA